MLDDLTAEDDELAAVRVALAQLAVPVPEPLEIALHRVPTTLGPAGLQHLVRLATQDRRCRVPVEPGGAVVPAHDVPAGEVAYEDGARRLAEQIGDGCAGRGQDRAPALIA